MTAPTGPPPADQAFHQRPATRRRIAHPPKVAVVGGSVGGLTAALVLRDLGCEVDVFERSTAELEGRGAGIALHPITVRYFEQHRPPDLAEVVVELPWLRFLDRGGAVRYEERMNYRVSSWNTLYRNLLAAFDPGRYHLGCEMVGLDQDPDRATVRFAGGETAAADLVVCADGISSRARAILQPRAKLRYAGYVAWRGVVPEWELTRSTAERLGDAITYHLTDRGHILLYPIPGRSGETAPGRRLQSFVWYRNYAEGGELEDLLTDRTGARRGSSVPPGWLRGEHAAWAREYAAAHFPTAAAEVVAGTRDPFVQVVFDAAVDRMAFGRICLIGDGAVSVRPHAAAGTAKACADAWALGAALRKAEGDAVAALEAWEWPRLELGHALLERARWIGDGSQFRRDWTPGDPRLRFGLYEPGDAVFPSGDGQGKDGTGRDGNP